MNLHGIIPPIVTPMFPNEDVDYDRLKTLIDYQISKGVHGLFVLGTTGEFYSLSESEKQAIMATAVEHVQGRVPVFAGTGAETTREVIRLNKIAEKEKITGVSVITPYYIAPTQEEIANHYRRIAENTSLPVLLYSNPAMGGGIKIDLETVVRLSEIPNIVGIKDSGGDLQHVIELVKQTPKHFVVLQGRDTLIWSGLQIGIKGAIPATCNIAPELPVGIYESFRKGDVAKAWEYQQRLGPVRIAMSLGTPPGSIKVAMSLLGQSVGPSRSPVAAMPSEKQEKLKSTLIHAGLLKGEVIR